MNKIKDKVQMDSNTISNKEFEGEFNPETSIKKHHKLGEDKIKQFDYEHTSNERVEFQENKDGPDHVNI